MKVDGRSSEWAIATKHRGAKKEEREERETKQIDNEENANSRQISRCTAVYYHNTNERVDPGWYH